MTTCSRLGDERSGNHAFGWLTECHRPVDGGTRPAAVAGIM
jgi:hypothetical protein